jgi:beta-lactamase regulating signal transducer with metallopeptidase domain
MAFIAVMQDSTNLLAQVAEPALRALALAGAAGVGLRVFRVKATSLRLFTWTAVLYGALALPLLGWMLPPLAVPAPGFLVSPVASSGAKQFAEKLAFGWRGASSAAMKPFFSDTPLAPEAANSSPSANRKAHTEASGSIAALKAPRHPKSSLETKSPLASTSFLDQNSSLLTESPSRSQSTLRWLAAQSSGWIAAAAWVYLAVALALLTRMLVGIEFSRRLLRAAHDINDLRATRRLASRSDAAGLTFLPQIAESELISVPITLGAMRSTILLPLEWREWDEAKLDAVIAHEVAHVARRDGLTQRLSLLHRALFWFSPLTWWLDRKLAELAEQASDEAALSGGADRNEYARTLLGFFEALQATPGRVWWQGVAMAKPGVSERQTARLVEERLERILSWKGSVAMGAKNMIARKSIAVIVLVLAIPVVYVAASARPIAAGLNSQAAQTAQAPASSPAPTPANNAKPSPAIVPDEHVAPAPEIVPDAQVAPAADLEITETPEAAPQAEPPMPPAVADGISGGISGGLSAPLAPAAPLAPWPPAAPRAYSYSYRNSQSNSSSYSSDASPYSSAPSSDVMAYDSNGKSFYRYSYDTDNDERWVIVSGKSDSLTMSGDMGDAHHVEKLKKQIAGDFIWFERGDKSYVIRDQATIDRARKLWAPQSELDKKQEALGAQQEALGKQQEELGSKMEQVQIKVPDMTAELDKLKAELKALSSSATVEDVGRVQSEIGDLQSRIAQLQSQAGEQQGELGRQQGELGRKQGQLGRQQGELGRQQAALAREANRQMKSLLDEAVKKGVAQLEL